jgi:Zn-dependent peptidase ImmA (M78 family)/DNA-binding XRE family transcriptional regulator
MSTTAEEIIVAGGEEFPNCIETLYSCKPEWEGPVFAERLKLARRGAGLSLRALAERMGHAVSAQALGKYERGEMMPSSPVLMRLAAALDVPESYLLSGNHLQLRDVEFRKHAVTGAKRLAHLRAQVMSAAERYLEVEDALAPAAAGWEPPRGFPYRVAEPGDAESAAGRLRAAWKLGEDAIPGLAELVEERGAKVLVLDLDETISGMTAKARRGADGEVPIIVLNRRHPGERQRFTLAHELGHLLLEPLGSADSEKACHRFAGAFLVPAGSLRAEVGRIRHSISLGELVRLKALFLVSMQCLVYRMRDLAIISPAVAGRLFREMSRLGYRKAEPLPLPGEKTQRFERLCFRALSEGLISESKAGELLGVSVRELDALLDGRLAG